MSKTLQTIKNLSKNKKLLIEWMEYYREYDPMVNASTTPSAFADKRYGNKYGKSKAKVRMFRQKCGFIGQVRKGDTTTVGLISPKETYRVAIKSNDYRQVIEDQIDSIVCRFNTPQTNVISPVQQMPVHISKTTTPETFQILLDAVEKSKGKIKYSFPDGSTAEIDFK